MANESNKETKLSVRDYIHYIGVILLTMALFVALLFVFKGSLVFSIPIALLFAILFIGVVFLLRWMRNSEQDYKLIEMSTLVLGYGGLLCISLFLFLHFINVEFTLKEQIKRDAAVKLNKCLDLESEYAKYVDNQVAKYDTEIDNMLHPSTGETKRKEFLNRYNIEAHNRSDYKDRRGYPSKAERDSTGDKYSAFLKQKLESESDVIGKDITDYVSREKQTFEDWNYLRVPLVYSELNVEYSNWESALQDLSSEHPWTENQPFTTDASFDSEMQLSNPREYFSRTPWGVAIPIFLLLHAMILWPYLTIYKREIKYKNDTAERGGRM